MNLDRTGGAPLYQQIADRLTDAIQSETIAPGDHLGNEIALAGQFGVSRSTMRQAIRTLVVNGLVVHKKGTGTTVLPGAITRPLRLTSISADRGRDDERPETIVLVNEVIATPGAVRHHLQLSPRQPFCTYSGFAPGRGSRWRSWRTTYPPTCSTLRTPT